LPGVVASSIASVTLSGASVGVMMTTRGFLPFQARGLFDHLGGVAVRAAGDPAHVLVLRRLHRLELLGFVTNHEVDALGVVAPRHAVHPLQDVAAERALGAP
jgi:hypothetical protein